MTRIALIGIALAAFAAFLLSGPAAIRTSSPTADLRLSWGAEPESLDPPLVSGLMESWYLNALFEGLVAFAEDGITPAPGVAERWEVSNDGLTWTFHLRRSQWSDGTPVTAADFVRSWRRALDPKTGGVYSDMLYVIKNGAAVHKKTLPPDAFGARSIDDRTIEVRLEQPTPYFLDVAAFMTLLPVNERCVARWGDDWVKPGNLVCNGPFTLESWTPNYKIVLRKNPRYWDAARVALDRVECFVIDRPTTALNLYESGDIDWLAGGAVPVDYIEVLRGRPDFITHAILSTAFLRFNVTKPPFDDPRVRKAFAMAVKKEDLTDKILRAGEIPAPGFVPPGFPGYDYPKGLPYDPAAARELLRSVYPDPARFPRVEFLTSNVKRSIDIFEVLQDQWRKNLGVTVEAKAQESKVYNHSMRERQYDLCFGRWIGDYGEPSTYINLFITGGDNNRTGWGNTLYDKLVGEAAAERDDASRYRIYNRCERMIVEEEAVIAPLWYNTGCFMIRPGLRGLAPNLMQRTSMKYARVK